MWPCGTALLVLGVRYTVSLAAMTTSWAQAVQGMTTTWGLGGWEWRGGNGEGGGRVELEFNKVGTKNPWLGDTVTICLFVKIPIMSTFL